MSFQFLPWWSGSSLPRWQRCLPAGPDVGGHAGSLSGPCILPPFSPNELLGETSLEGLGDDAIPPVPNVGTCPGTFLCPFTIPFHRWTGPPSLLASWQRVSSASYSHATAPVIHDN